MALYDWIVTYLLPIIGDIPPYELKVFTTIFWVFVSVCVTHFLVAVPYYFFTHLIGFKGGLLPWVKSKHL